MRTFVEEAPVLQQTDVCCAEFNPARWDEVTHHWKNKLFLKGTVPEFFHVPLPHTFGKEITRMMTTAEKAGVLPDAEDHLVLCYDPSAFKGILLMAVTKQIHGEDHVYLNGTFISKVFEGPYSRVPEFMHEMDQYLASKNTAAKRHYFYYAYCPKCAEKYGHNYIADFAEVKHDDRSFKD